MAAFLVTHETTRRDVRMVHARNADAAARSGLEDGEGIDAEILSSQVTQVKPARATSVKPFLTDEGAMGDEPVECEEVIESKPTRRPPRVRTTPTAASVPDDAPFSPSDLPRRLTAGETVRMGDSYRLNARQDWGPVPDGLIGHIVKVTDRAEFRTMQLPSL